MTLLAVFLCNLCGKNEFKSIELVSKIVHAFSYDPVLIREYDHPFRFLEKTAGYYAVCSPDFSMHPGMERWQIIQAVGMSRWFGAFCQSYGRRVYPTVGWANPDTYDICFAGLEDDSTFFISTLGVNNDPCRESFLMGLNELRKRFPHSRQICIGSRVEGMPDDICLIPYAESFGSQVKAGSFLQLKLLNWDGSLNEEVC